MTRERIAKAPNLKLIVTAGIGSDHTDLDAAVEAGITVRRRGHLQQLDQRLGARGDDDPRARRNGYPRSYGIVVDGGWNIADAVSRSYDLESNTKLSQVDDRHDLIVIEVITRYRPPELVIEMSSRNYAVVCCQPILYRRS